MGKNGRGKDFDNALTTLQTPHLYNRMTVDLNNLVVSLWKQELAYVKTTKLSCFSQLTSSGVSAKQSGYSTLYPTLFTKVIHTGNMQSESRHTVKLTVAKQKMLPYQELQCQGPGVPQLYEGKALDPQRSLLE